MPNDHTNIHPIVNTVPPKGDEAKGEKYVSDLIRLIETGKIQVHKTDLSQFNPSSLQNHYRIDLEDFQIEISHSSHLDTGANSFVLIFNNLKNIADGAAEKAILAYIHLSESQYQRFFKAAHGQIDRLEKIESEKRFIQAVQPLDTILANLEQSNKDIFKEKLEDIKHTPLPEEAQTPVWEENSNDQYQDPSSEETLPHHSNNT